MCPYNNPFVVVFGWFQVFETNLHVKKKSSPLSEIRYGRKKISVEEKRH